MESREIVAALTAPAGELDRRGVSAEMYVVGGAAIALAFDERRATRDIDAVFEPKAAVYEAAAAVGERLGLPAGWLNDAVKGFLEGEDPRAAPVLDLPGLRCLAASPETLLALKVLAHRVGEDEDDHGDRARVVAAQLAPVEEEGIGAPGPSRIHRAACAIGAVLVVLCIAMYRYWVRRWLPPRTSRASASASTRS